jgi:glycosyltransferase involved in cell wall biosynthesis
MIETTPLVSVLMPCYNAEDTLLEALDSLRDQTISDYEIIAVDDGSTDATSVILASWAATDPRIRIYTQPHQGILVALNTGLQHSRAPYIARMDTDDHAYPERLQRQLAYLDEHPQVALVSCQVRGFPEEHVREGFRLYIEWQNSLISNEEIQKEIFVESPFAHPSVTLRRDWIERAGGYQERGWAEDYDLWLRLYLGGAQFAKIPQVLLAWRESPRRLTRMDGRYSLENFLRAKAHYLARGPLSDRDGIIIWGAGMTGRRLSKHLSRQELPLVAFIDIDPKKIGKMKRGLPILSPQVLSSWWGKFQNPALLAAVGARRARGLIRARLSEVGLIEGRDWWGVA